ncbi:MAG: hypothetical protein IJW19_08415 [Clostridia bacterium]|nr:hypothetical protein [Clostridia bacterium]
MNAENELDYRALVERLEDIGEKSPYVHISYIGATVMGRRIPLVTIGNKDAKKGVLYVSTHHATENICTSVMLNFIEDYASLISTGKYACGINTRVLHEMRRICIIPMLNPDGVEYRLHGVDESNPLKERLLQYNGGWDFNLWNANGRGVDLNHNYNAGFDEYKRIECESGITPGRSRYSGESPESEPEVSAITEYINSNIDVIDGILTFHTQGEEIFYKSMGYEAPGSAFLAKRIAKMTGYRISCAEGLASYGGLTDWFVRKYNKPSFTIECGKGKNPLGVSQISSIYLKLRETLYTFPILI